MNSIMLVKKRATSFVTQLGVASVLAIYLFLNDLHVLATGGPTCLVAVALSQQ